MRTILHPLAIGQRLLTAYERLAVMTLCAMRARSICSPQDLQARFKRTWYVTEGDEEVGDACFSGFVIGVENKSRYVMLSELEAARGPLGLPIERDLYFDPQPFSEIKRLERL